MKLFRKIIAFLKIKYNETFYVGATDKIPPPLKADEELKYLTILSTGEGDVEYAKKQTY